MTVFLCCHHIVIQIIATTFHLALQYFHKQQSELEHNLINNSVNQFLDMYKEDHILYI